MNVTFKSYLRGISVLEILLFLAVITVVSAFAVPTLNKSSAKADLNSALELVDQAVYLARDTAKSKRKEVVLHMDADPRKEQHSIHIYFADSDPAVDTGIMDQEFLLPPNVRMETEFASVHFDSAGKIEYSTRVTLTSNRDSDLTERFLIH